MSNSIHATNPINMPYRRLSKIFADTNSIYYGPFKIIKKSCDDFEQAVFCTYDRPIKLEVSQARVMALLIDQQGDYLTTSMLAFGMETPHYDKLHNRLQFCEQPVARARALEDLKNILTAKVCHIRRAIRKEFDTNPNGEPDAALSFVSFKPNRSAGEPGPSQPKMETGYRLKIDF